MTVLASSVQDSPWAWALLGVLISVMTLGFWCGRRSLSRIYLLILRDRRDNHDGLGQRIIIGDGKIDLGPVPRRGDGFQPGQRAAGQRHGGHSARKVHHPH